MISSGQATVLSRRDRVVISACLVLLTALAWAYLIHLDREMSAAMDYGKMMADMGMAMDEPWKTTDVLLAFAMWAVMMVGMMSATALPVLLLFADMHTQRTERRASLLILLFGLGYITIWLGFSASAALMQWALHQSAWLSPGMAATSPRLAGTILIAAGAYQLTPAKGACLRQCQSPLGFLLSHWCDRASGALQMGLRHGVYCLGCCWALMCVLFAVGVMNLVWVAALTAFILLEKFGSIGAVITRIGGVAMIAFGIFVLTR